MTGPHDQPPHPPTATQRALLLGIVLAVTAIASPARADGSVGVVVVGEDAMRLRLAAQITDWLGRHGHTVVAAPLPPDAIPALADCFVLEKPQCARSIVEKRARSTSMIYARLDPQGGGEGARTIAVTAYWFDRGHDAIGERKVCERCTDQALRTTAEEMMRRLIGGDGHVKLTSSPSGARILIDGQPIGVTPLDWDLPPGKHTIAMDKPGLARQSRQVVIVSDKTQDIDIDLAPPDTEGGGAMRYASLGMAITGGLAVASGAILYATDQDRGRNYPARIRNTAPLGIGLGIGGVLVGGVGTYLLLFHAPRKTSAPVAIITSDIAYVGWTGRF